ncbi:MAG: NAD(P)/FAD-dependent oxidoreductase [Planctomycetota bacterium]
MIAPNEDSWTAGPKKKWLVVGGGMMGLKQAYDLVRRGQDVTIAEAAPQFGGLTSVWKLDDVTWDRYYHATLMSDTRLRALLEDIDLQDQLRWVTTKTGFYTDGELYSMSDTSEFLKFPPLNIFQKLRLGGTIFYASRIRNWKRLEKLHVSDWLRRWSGNAVFEKIWQPLLRAKLGESYKKTSAAFIWAHTSRMYKARRSGMKTEMFGYVPGGYASILQRLQEVLREEGVRLLADHPVKEIVSMRDENLEHEGPHLRVNYGDGRVDFFDNVLLTIPSPVIAEICPGLSEEEKSRHRGIEYLGVVCTSLLTKKSISPYYVTNITDTWVPLTGVIEMSRIVDSESQLGGQHLIYLPKYLHQDDPGFGESDAEIEERCLETLEKMYDHFSRDDVSAIKTSRSKYVMALPTLRYSERLPPVVTTVPGLYAPNAAHIVKGNLNVNETIDLGEEKLREDVWPDFLARSNADA